MAISKRFPARGEAFTAFALTLLAADLWTFGRFIYTYPRFTQLMTPGDLVGLAGYFGAAALLDVLPIWLALWTAACLLPERWLRRQFGVQAGLTGMLLIVWVVLLLRRVVRFGSPWTLVGATAVLAVAALALIGWALGRFPRAAALLRAAIDRLLVLAVIYLALNLLGVAIVLARNVF